MIGVFFLLALAMFISGVLYLMFRRPAARSGRVEDVQQIIDYGMVNDNSADIP